MIQLLIHVYFAQCKYSINELLWTKCVLFCCTVVKIATVHCILFLQKVEHVEYISRVATRTHLVNRLEAVFFSPGGFVIIHFS